MPPRLLLNCATRPEKTLTEALLMKYVFDFWLPAAGGAALEIRIPLLLLCLPSFTPKLLIQLLQPCL